MRGSVPIDPPKLNRYRRSAMYGGLFVGLVIGIAVVGPNLTEWGLSRVGGTMGGCVVLGVVVSFLIVEIALRTRGGDDASAHAGEAHGDIDE